MTTQSSLASVLLERVAQFRIGAGYEAKNEWANETGKLFCAAVQQAGLTTLLDLVKDRPSALLDAAVSHQLERVVKGPKPSIEAATRLFQVAFEGRVHNELLRAIRLASRPTAAVA